MIVLLLLLGFITDYDAWIGLKIIDGAWGWVSGTVAEFLNWREGKHMKHLSWCLVHLSGCLGYLSGRLSSTCLGLQDTYLGV